MRAVRPTLALVLAVSLAGCASWSKWRPGDKVKTPPADGAQIENRIPTEADLVRYLNRESASLRTVDCEDLDVDCTVQGKRLPALRGDLVCEKPRNFRLRGKVTGIQQVDFGSNQERFWFWVKQAPEPHLFHCAYTDYDKGVQLPFPFNPDWVVQALGMAEYGKDDAKLERFKIEVKDKTFELTEDSTLQGKPVKKVTVFDRRRISPPHPQVIAHVVKDAGGRVLCAATIKEVRASKAVDSRGDPIVYPRKVLLEWPAEQLSMTLTLDGVRVNEQIPPNESARLFALPNWREYKSVDLAQQLRVSPSSRVEQTGGYYYRQ